MKVYQKRWDFLKVKEGFAQNLVFFRNNLNEYKWNGLGQLSSSVSNLLLSIIIVYGFGLTVLGVYSVAFLILMLMRGIIEGSLLQPISSIRPKIGNRSKNLYLGLSILLLFSILAILNLAAVGTFFLLAFTLVDEVSITTFVCFMLMSTAFLIADFLRHFLIISGKSKQAAFLESGRLVSQSTLLVTVILTEAFGESLNAIDMIFLSVFFASLVSIAPFVAFLFQARFRRVRQRAMLRKHISLARKNLPIVATQYAGASFPFYWATATLGSEVVGIARALQSLAGLINLPTLAMLHVTATRTAQELKSTELQRALAIVERYSWVAFTLAASASVLVAPIASIVMEVAFGGEMRGYEYIFWLYCLFFTANTINGFYGIGLVALENFRILAKRFVGGLVFSTLLSILLIAPLGITALPMIQTLVAVAGAVFLWDSFRKIKHRGHQ